MGFMPIPLLIHCLNSQFTLRIQFQNQLILNSILFILKEAFVRYSLFLKSCSIYLLWTVCSLHYYDKI